MRWLLTSVALLAGCDRVFGLERDPITVDARTCFGKSGEGATGLLEYCPPLNPFPPLAQEYVLPADVDTDPVPAPPCTDTLRQGTDDTEICIITAKTIIVRGSTSLHGGRPLVLVATHELIVEPGATIDVASTGTKIGSGAPNAICADRHSGGPTTTVAGAGGGAGGGFHGAGAAGGNGGVTGSLGGMPDQLIALGGIRPGCDGGQGGNGTPAATIKGGDGGHGGGALYLIAGERIDIQGDINASGAGGSGGVASGVSGAAGGGGGGSGGVIGLDAPAVSIAAGAKLAANGGGGGGGGAASSLGAQPGKRGDDASVFAGAFPFLAKGGPGGTANGGAGGDGGAIGVDPKPGVNGTTGGGGLGGGGGGGGGAAGYITIYTLQLDDTGAFYSPTHAP